jgi:hypothetical protein
MSVFGLGLVMAVWLSRMATAPVDGVMWNVAPVPPT